MRAIVLVKQVPDLRVGGVGVHPDGTIDRAAAPPITNPADLHALAAATAVADEVIAVSMGPAQAERALRDAIASGANRGVLLCDHAFAGSDTWATANALAAAVRVLGGADLVLCGISAIDGETGQVGPSVAQRLGWPQATGCEALTVADGMVQARRVVEGGYETLRMPLPAVVTVGETGFAPAYPTMQRRRAAVSAVIDVLTAQDLGLGVDDVGLAASPTKVARMAPSPWPDRGCRFVGDDGFGYPELAATLVQRGAFTPREELPTDLAASPISAPSLPAAPADFWVVTQVVDGRLDRASSELLARAAELAPTIGSAVAAVLLCADPGVAVADAAAHGADVVYLAVDPALTPYRAEPHARVIATAATMHRPQVILLAASTTGRDLAPRVASMLHTGLAADCTDVQIGSWTRAGVTRERLLHMVRPAMAGGVLATCLCPEARPQMATVRPGVFEPHLLPRAGVMVPLPVALEPDDLRVDVVDRHISAADVDLRDADVVIAGGAGCDAAGWHLVEELAAAIGGRVAASRGAVEAGLAPRALQVGQTGATVRPRLYIACGISGALQHAVGMQDSATIVAINRNPEAAVFRLAHFGIVADVADALPQLSEALAGAR